MIESFCEELLEDKEVRSNLIALRQQIKSAETEQTALAQWEAEHGKLKAYLRHEDAKVRKNAALLLGETKSQPALDVLWEAYQNEQTRFVKSAYLTALEALDCSPYQKQLQETYDRLCAAKPQEDEKKHIQEEIKVLQRMIRKSGAQKKHPFEGYHSEAEVLLVTNPGYREVTASQIRQGKTALVPMGVRVKTRDISELLSIRTYRELLFCLPLKKRMEADEKAVAKTLCDADLLPLLERLHTGAAPFYFRLEVKSNMEEKHRRAFIHKLAAAIEEQSQRRLINSADDYEIEIRLTASVDGRLYPYIKLFTIPMNRFAYRKYWVASSMQPSTAALLMRLAASYLKKDAQVLDPFCGVGTMLIERNLLVAAGDLYGTDIFGEAIVKARENAAAAGMEIHFINRNMFDFTHRYLFDEIVADMPPRGAKSKEQQDVFYADFFEKASELLKRDSVIVMYSNESGFTKKQLRLREDFCLINEYCIREKSGYYLFIIGFKG